MQYLSLVQRSCAVRVFVFILYFLFKNTGENLKTAFCFCINLMCIYIYIYTYTLSRLLTFPKNSYFSHLSKQDTHITLGCVYNVRSSSQADIFILPIYYFLLHLESPVLMCYFDDSVKKMKFHHSVFFSQLREPYDKKAAFMH